MSETRSDAASVEAPAEPAKIDFERAEFAGPAGEHVECGLCKRAITTEYWHYLGKVLCDSCREIVHRTTADARLGATFGKALLLGGGTALGCGIGYAIFVGVTQFQFALVTIGIGWAIGRSIQRITRGFGSRKHQVLAVALTYFASSMGYLPGILKGFSELAHHSEQSPATSSSTSTPAESPTPPAPGTTTPIEAPPTGAGGSAAPGGVGAALSVVFLVVVSGLLMLAAPFIEITDGFNGVLGLLIIFFGLRTAWRVSKGVGGAITGPHKVVASAGV